MTEITMPKLSDSMEEGTVLSWLCADGEQVSSGDELVEIETDKATMTYESPATGTLSIVAAEGTTLAVGELIARVGDRVQLASTPTETDGSAASPATVTSMAPSTAPTAASTESPASSSATAPEPGSATPTLASDNNHGHSLAHVRATPLAKRFAMSHGVDLASVKGSGPRGRVLKADVASKLGIDLPASATSDPPMAVPSAPAVAEPTAATGAKGTITQHQLSRLQQVVARRMSEAKATIPDFQLQTEVAMAAAIALRQRLKEVAGEAAPSLNDMVVKACGIALREHPRANGAYLDGRFETYSRINVGIAVAAPDALIVPTITDADTRSLGSIAAEARRLALRARVAEITPPELSGGTFTVSNLGMYGMSSITPVINPPQAAILGVGAIRPVPGLNDGELVERQVLTLTLSCDHRILYGADAAQFLSRIRELLEQPLMLAL
jgi:pyruvate dehydrogenase E2 component (dihydrolipoamide acetyltransferase)